MSDGSSSPARQRVAPELLEELCIELRWVAVFDYALSCEKAKEHIRKTRELHAALLGKGADILGALASLSKETGWRMGDLLADCLRYPEVVPYVREADGLRRHLRCRRCGTKERPIDAKLFWFCDDCLEELIEALRAARQIAGVFMFRTYSSGMRCSHANDDTVLVSEIDFDQTPGVCELCLRDELARRHESQFSHQ
jgi:hypothetical protein